MGWVSEGSLRKAGPCGVGVTGKHDRRDVCGIGRGRSNDSS